MRESLMTSMDRLTSSKEMSGEPPGEAMLERLTQGWILLDDAVTELADADAIEALARFIAPRVDLPSDKVARAIDAPSEGGLTAVCRAAGLNINGFSAVLRMRRRRAGVTGTPAQALTAFQEMPLDAARRVVAMLKLRDRLEHSG